MKFLGFVGVLLVLLNGVKGAKLLGVFHMPSPSHYMSCSALMKILAEKGHDVTVVAAFTDKNPPKNYHQIHLDGLHELLEEGAAKMNWFETTPNPVVMPVFFNFMSNNLIENTFNHTTFKKFMNTKQTFDAVIIEEFQAEAIKYVAHHFNAPLIVYSALDANDWTNPFQGNPDTPSYHPSIYLSHLTNHMSFMERVQNTLMYAYSKIFFNLIAFPAQNKLLHKYYPDAPDLKDIAYNVSLVLLNSDPSVHEPVPKVPSMIDIGGFHIKKPKPLPEDLQKVLDDAKHGVIYFSLGSNIKSKDMPKHKRDFILKKFSTMNQVIIWKFEDPELPGKPRNVVIRKWLPQNDILAHKNVKLFISHGGLFSTMESVYHGKPVMAISVFAEQKLNGKRAEANGLARHVPFKELTEENFSELLDDLMSNPKYRENAQKRSQIMRDKPLDPADTINYWVEYVIRYHGTPHLRVAALDLEWYQYLLIDVVLFILAVAAIIIVSLKFLIKRLIKRKAPKEKKN
ncbi:UDP-glycosyltransferase UGT5-like isoform X1 [Coccinella septempunctata]|uniref:UDP-glycosyltransferase UGT5-like isoform X1 n=1 Tax=Coccinella septempunctata TaxID=41139 RepID=UPI001D07CB26|nr:UDP-glycosyltransferase UGT5-like isoform X1 [Coccinella septempunctata]